MKILSVTKQIQIYTNKVQISRCTEADYCYRESEGQKNFKIQILMAGEQQAHKLEVQS